VEGIQSLTALPQNRGERSLFAPIEQIRDPDDVCDDVTEIMHELSMRYLHKYTARVKEEMGFSTERAAWSRLCMSMATKELRCAFNSWFSSSNSEKNAWPPVPSDIMALAKASSAYQTRKTNKSSSQPVLLTPDKIDDMIKKFPEQYKHGNRRGTIEKI